MKWNYERRRDRWILFVVAVVAVLGAAALIASRADADHARVYARSRSFAAHTTLTWAKIHCNYGHHHGHVFMHGCTYDEDSPGIWWSKTEDHHGGGYAEWRNKEHGRYSTYYNLGFEFCPPVVGCTDSDRIELRLTMFGDGHVVRHAYENSTKTGAAMSAASVEPFDQIGNSAVAGLELARAAERGASMGENTRLL